MAEYILNQVASEVQKAIDNALNPDATLSVSGKPADAKAVGDALANISVGGNTMKSVEPAEDDIPKVFIDGVIPTTKDEVLATMQYISKTESFNAYLKIKCQGNSSMAYDKKNFTVKMYSDEARETKLNKTFKDWNHYGNKYVLKANYIDHSHARNIVCARLWNEVVSSREDYSSLPEEMAQLMASQSRFIQTAHIRESIHGILVKMTGCGAWMKIMLIMFCCTPKLMED